MINRNKSGSFVGIFVFIVVSLIIVLFSAVFIHMGTITEDKLKESLGDKDFGSADVNQTITDTFGNVNSAYAALYWIALFLMVAQILSILIGSYMVTTKPAFFVAYVFFTIVAIIVSVGISNGYETIIANETLAPTFAKFVGANEILLNLPYFITIIGFLGAIIMYSQIGRRAGEYAY
jgi:hypothetical protein